MYEHLPLTWCISHFTMQSEQRKGVVYPGDVEVTVKLNSSINCSTISSSGARCMDIARDVYNITINQTNDIGSTLNYTLQDCKQIDCATIILCPL